MRDYIIRNRISNLDKQPLTNFVNNAVVILLQSLSKYLSVKDLNEFKKGKTALNKYGICNGITLLIDEDLKLLHKQLCILDTDTLSKFKEDIRRDF